MAPQPHHTRATLSDVAAMAGVSVGTVQYVLSGNSKGSSAGSKATRDRVLQAARTLDYRPNRLARATRTGRSQMLLLSMTHLDDPWTAAMADSVDQLARTHDLRTFVLPSLDWYDALLGQQFDAAFLTRVDSTPETRRRLAHLAKLGVRLVVMSGDLEPAGYDVVRSDAAEGTRVATRHVLDREDIAYLAFYEFGASDSPNQGRLAAFNDVLSTAGLKLRPEWRLSARERSLGAMQAVYDLFRGPQPRPRAIVSDSAVGAHAALNAALMAGVSVPDELAIVGVGDLAPSQLGRPSVATAQHGHIFTIVSQLVVQAALANKPGSGAGELHEPAWFVERRDTA